MSRPSTSARITPKGTISTPPRSFLMRSGRGHKRVNRDKRRQLAKGTK